MTDESGDSDTEVTGNEYEELCRNCDKLCQKLAEPDNPKMEPDYKNWQNKNSAFKIIHRFEDEDGDRCPHNIVDMFGRRFKKDSRTWLHKSTKKLKENKTNVIPGYTKTPSICEDTEDSVPKTDGSHSSESDDPYTIIDTFGRKFKKDSRTWLHKNKRVRLNQDTSLKNRSLFVSGPPTDYYMHKNSEVRGFDRSFINDGVLKTTDTNSKDFHPPNALRKRKRRSQISCTANSHDYRYNAEICRILSSELDDNTNYTKHIRKTSDSNIFEVFGEDDDVLEDDDDYDCEKYRPPSTDRNRLSSDWRETRAITSDTSTQSSNENNENSVNQSPLSSGASINLIPEANHYNGAPNLTSTAANNFYGKFSVKPTIDICGVVSSDHIDNDARPPGNAWTVVNSSSNFSENSSLQQTSCLKSRKMNVNTSRSVCFLIAETDEFLADHDDLSDYEEESDG